MAQIQTVLGPVDDGRIGRTLAHEHVINVTDWVQRDFPDLSWGDDRAVIVAEIRAKLAEIKANGIDTIIDCTAMGHSRDAAALAEANAGVDINIVLSTGLYTYDALPYFFLHRKPSRAEDGSVRDVMVDMFVRDISQGVQGTAVRAGIIKCATDKEGVTPNIDRILRAAAWAHRRTGVPITTHTDAHAQTGLDQQRIFLEEGVDLSRVVIGHSGDTDDYDYLRKLLDAGSFIGADRFGLYRTGWPSMDQRIAIVRTLVDAGYADQILLSHDASIFSDWRPRGVSDPSLPAQWNGNHIPTEVVPAMLSAGISQGAIDKMLIHNPRRLLMPGKPY